MQKFIKKICFFIVTRLLKLQATRLLKRNPQVKIIGVTGSVGKTTTKLAVAEVLQQKYKVQAHPGNYNSETGVPLALFEMESPGSVLALSKWCAILWKMEKKIKQPFPYEIVVMELGASKANDISYFKFLKPDIGVVVAAKVAHLEGFKTIETIIQEKFKLAQFSREAFINIDDLNLKNKVQELPAAKVKTYGTVKEADYWYEKEKTNSQDSFQGQMHLQGQTLPVNLSLFSEQNLQAAIAGAALGHHLGLSVEEIKNGLTQVGPIAGRMTKLVGKNNSLILDDTYNANPEAVIAALKTLYGQPGKRKIAILGGMNELGPNMASFHQEVSQHMGQLDLLITVAEFAKLYVPGAIKSGLKEEQIKSFDNPYEAGDYVTQILQEGDVVLVKGSQGGIFAEEAVAKLLANPKEKEKLVRQSAFWEKVKKRTFEKGQPTHED